MLTYGFSDQTQFCDDGRQHQLFLEKMSTLIFHRLSFNDDAPAAYDDVQPTDDSDLEVIEVARRFRDTRRYRPGDYTAGEMPYGALVRTTGAIEQALPFTDYGPHSRRWSLQGFGIAVVGDFIRHDPTKQQTQACVEFGALLVAAYDLDAFGHTELPGASGNPNKRCPGTLFDMDGLRVAIAAHEYRAIPQGMARKLLVGLGFRV